MNRKKVLRRLLYASLAVLGVVIIYRFTRPVLFHWPGDCVCTDYSPEVEGYSIWNPLRNRAPEHDASHFLEDLRDDKVSASATPELNADIRSRKVPHTHNMAWKLEYRENHGNLVSLYYEFYEGGMKRTHDSGSEGMVEVKLENGIWKADQFDVTW
jgi:hypothetical protein